MSENKGEDETDITQSFPCKSLKNCSLLTQQKTLTVNKETVFVLQETSNLAQLRTL